MLLSAFESWLVIIDLFNSDAQFVDIKASYFLLVFTLLHFVFQQLSTQPNSTIFLRDSF